MPMEITRIKDIFNELHNLYGEDVSDEEYDKEYKEDSKDISFLKILCFGPWREERRKDEEKQMLEHIRNKKIGRLTDINEENYKELYTFEWQRKKVLSLAEFLKKECYSFDNFLSKLENEYPNNSMKIIEELAKATNEGKVPDTHKIISVFVRDIMKRDAFPLDNRVKEILGFLGLPNDEELIIKLCRKNGVNPRILNRMLWLHNGGDDNEFRGYCNNGCKNNENECPIKSECYRKAIEKKLRT